MAKQIPVDQAERFVTRGMAQWTSLARKKICFIPSHQRDSAQAEALARRTAQDRYYGNKDMLTREQIQALPLLMVDKALVNPKKVRTTVHRNGKVKTIVEDGIEMNVRSQRSSSETI